ncbi:MAG: biotin/lipoyl-containing protein, partial [Gammaproteobacteria bacterium]|nr:biotin/lipoyl-containing protein [Gammaproteobacteria bacterium]
AGEALPFEQDELDRDGHAIEVRLYAEKPKQDFLPSVGLLQAFVTPEESMHFRLDTGVETGDEITIHYDPMIAKLVVWNEDRETALGSLRDALNQTAVFGVTTNLPLLRKIAQEEAFVKGDVDTRYIDNNLEALNTADAAPEHFLDAAALDIVLDTSDAADWDRGDGFQVNALGGRRFVFRDEADVETTRFARRRDMSFIVRTDEGERELTAQLLNDTDIAVSDGNVTRRYTILRLEDAIQVACDGECHELLRIHPFAATDVGGADEKHPGSPMPGRIVAVHVKEGDEVAEGDPILVLEGMKMEYTLKAGISGKIEKLLFGEGDMVDAEVPLVDIAADE